MSYGIGILRIVSLAALAAVGCREAKLRSASPTSAAVPPAALLVSSVEPPDGATEIDEGVRIRVRFSRSVDPTTIAAATFRVIDEGIGRPVEGTIAFESPSVVAFLPRQALRTPSVWHRIELEPCIRASDGGRLDAALSPARIPSRFRTRESPDADPPYFFFLMRSAEAIGPTAIRLEWFPAVDVGYRTPPGAMVYAIYVGRPPGPVDLSAPHTVVERGSTTAVVRGLEPDTLYGFIVRARDLAGNEDANEVVVSSRTLPADSPLGLTIIWSSDVAGNLEPCG